MKIKGAGLMSVYSYKTYRVLMIISWKRCSSGDEATFHVSGAVNRRNVRIWGSENPHAYVEHQHDSPKVNVFCAIASQKVYCPFFCAEETVTDVTYLHVLQLLLMSQLQNIPIFIFHQEVNPTQFYFEARQYLNTVLPERWIGRAS
jgi:hypothetical protein